MPNKSKAVQSASVQPRQYTRHPGSDSPGRRPSGRTKSLPRIRPEVHGLALLLAEHHGFSLAEAVEFAILEAGDSLV